MDQPAHSPSDLPGEWFARVAVPALFAPFASDLVRAAAPRPGQRVLDVACGTGIVAENAARRLGPGAAVAGIDLNQRRISAAQRRMQRSGIPVWFVHGVAERLPFEPVSFDLVFCQFGLMLFGDPLAALREMKRVLTSDGRLLISVWDSIDLHPLDKEIHERSLERLGASGLEGVYSLGNEWLLRHLIARAGFEHVQIEKVAISVTFPDPGGYLDWQMQVDPEQSPVLRGLDAAERHAALSSLRSELEGVLKKYVRDGVLRLEFHALRVMCRLFAGT